MAKYIDADRLNADLDKWVEAMADAEGDYSDGVRFAIQHFIFLLASLQQEQPDVDLEKELADYCHRYYNYDYPKQAEEGTGSSVMPHIIEAAKYFYELGLNARKEETK